MFRDHVCNPAARGKSQYDIVLLARLTWTFAVNDNDRPSFLS